MPALPPPCKTGRVVKLAFQYKPDIQGIRISIVILMGDDDEITLDWNTAIFLKNMQVSKIAIHWYIIEMFWKHQLWKDSIIFQRQHTVNQHPFILKYIQLTYNPKKEYKYYHICFSKCGIIPCQKYNFLHLKCFRFIISWMHHVLYIFYMNGIINVFWENHVQCPFTPGLYSFYQSYDILSIFVCGYWFWWSM